MTPLSSKDIEQQLDSILDCELNRLDPEPIARALAANNRLEQNRALYWITIGSQAHIEIGYCLALNASNALRLMTDKMMEAWVVHAMHFLDTQGLRFAIEVINNAEKFAKEAQERVRGVTFDEVSGMLSLFVQGLSGRRLTLEQSEIAWTDTEVLYLPSYVGRFEEQQDNFRLYKSILAHQWAQVWFGTWRIDHIDPEDTPVLTLFKHIKPSRLSDNQINNTLNYLHTLETIRLDACIARELPGIYRDMQYVLNLLDESIVPTHWNFDLSSLKSKHATIKESCKLLETALQYQPSNTLCFQGNWETVALLQAMKQRIKKEKGCFQKAVWRLSEELKEKQKDKVTHAQKSEEDSELKKPSKEELDDFNLPDDFRFDILLEDDPMQITPDTRDAMNSILQDFGEIPEEYLDIGFAGAFNPNEEREEKKDIWGGTYHEEGASVYQEWDYKRQHYRKDWCVLRELEVKPANISFVHNTLNKYHKLVKQIHTSFEALRGEDKLLKQQINGDDIDIDAYVEAWGDAKMGMEMTDRLYTKNQRVERSIAVMFMVDMSGSTNGWINEAEREALILLCEALEKLGDRYAIFGFSGWARKRCEVFHVKRFDERYGDDVRGRIAGIEAQNYTRMGVAIRHFSEMLNAVDAKTRILITLSDGRPEDYDDYRGKYGIEDTRMALIEARRMGIHPFCITIDKEGLDYLPHMYGKSSYVVLDDIAQLPLKVADIYRKLTT